MVEVYKTSITDERSAAIMLELLQNRLPEAKINFDLEDCDNILRVESDIVATQPITELVQQNGFDCEVLE